MNEEQKLNEKEEKLKKKLEQLETMERAIPVSYTHLTLPTT